jgi:hypothetical protein
MPIPGRKPKAEGEKRHSHAPRHDWVEVVDTPYDGPVPKLPSTRANGKKWPARTRKKWGVWSRMPHCVLWGEAEWEFALESLEVAALFHETGAATMATELRNREKLLGTTLDFRRSLRIRYVEEVEQPEAADVTSINDYRDRI